MSGRMAARNKLLSFFKEKGPYKTFLDLSAVKNSISVATERKVIAGMSISKDSGEKLGNIIAGTISDRNIYNYILQYNNRKKSNILDFNKRNFATGLF